MNYLIDLIIAWWRYDEWHPVHNRVNAYFTKAIELGVTDITYTKFTQIVIHYNGGVITAWDSHGSRSGGWLADGEVVGILHVSRPRKLDDDRHIQRKDLTIRVIM